MKIFIDIGHPAHVHYFKNFIKIMASKNHDIFITARNKEVTFKLLDAYKISYISRGRGGIGLLGKFLYMVKGDRIIIQYANKFKPNIFLSFASPYTAHASYFSRKPHIALTDTEHAKFGKLGFIPFSDSVITPDCYFEDIGSRQLKVASFMELFYLHPKYFKPDQTILNELKVEKGEKYIVLRFVAWQASHDLGQKGISFDYQMKLVNELRKYAKIFISSEAKLPAEIEKFRLNISPEKIHEILYYASLYIGEGATMASECAMLGTPAIYINSLDAGTLREQEKLGLLYNLRNEKKCLEIAIKLLSNSNVKTEWQEKRNKMLNNKIDITAFLVWFVENYPESKRLLKENPDFQYKFL